MNEMYFSKKQIEAGEFSKFVEMLMGMSYGKGDLYSDIHIRPDDCEAFVVEWEQAPWSHEWGGQFKYVDEDEVVMKEYRLPNNTIVYCQTKEEYDEELKIFLLENPEWKKSTYGIWYNENEQREFQ